MSQAIAFDTLAYVKKLRAAGVPEQQAEIQAEALAELVEERLATKRDLKELEVVLRSDIRALEDRLTIRLGKMLAWSTGLTIVVLGAMIKLL